MKEHKQYLDSLHRVSLVEVCGLQLQTVDVLNIGSQIRTPVSLRLALLFTVLHSLIPSAY